MSQEYSSLYLPSYLPQRCNSKCCHHILYFCVHYKSLFTFYFCQFSPKSIMKRKKKYIQSFILTHIFTFLAFFFPSSRFTFLFGVILQLEKYPLVFLVIQFFGQTNFSVFQKGFYFTLVFSNIFSVQALGGQNLCFSYFLSAFKNIIPCLQASVISAEGRWTFIFLPICTILFKCFQIIFNFLLYIWICNLIYSTTFG